MRAAWHTFVAAALCFCAIASHAAPDTFTVGVLRRDGIVVPFATYDGKRWRNRWPTPSADVDVPIDLRNVPSRWWGPLGPREMWQAWVGADPPRALRVRQPDWFDAHCQHQLGLRTDYRSTLAPPAPDAQPYPKDGLVVSPPQPVERIEILAVGQPPPAVVEAYNEAEDKVIRSTWRDRGGPEPLNRSRRELQMLKVEAIYALGDPAATRLYYFEVAKQYANPGGSDCPLVSFGAGWFVRDGVSPLRKLQFESALTLCERRGLLFMLPLGAMRIANQLFWIVQFSGWDYEEYDVLEIKPKKVEPALSVRGGGC